MPDGTYHYQVIAVYGNWTAVSSSSNTVTVDSTPPTVTINQAAGQVDPTNTSPVNYTVVFSEAVTGFTGTDITFTGTAGATTATVTGTGTGTTYNVAVSGVTTNGIVRPTIAAGRAQDGAGFLNTASTSTDNTVTYDTTPPTAPTTLGYTDRAAGPGDKVTGNVEASSIVTATQTLGPHVGTTYTRQPRTAAEPSRSASTTSEPEPLSATRSSSEMRPETSARRRVPRAVADIR